MKKKLVALALVAGLALTGGSALAASADGGKGRGAGLDGVLTGLVGKGTLTQSQVDAIKKAIEDQHAAAHVARDAQVTEFQNLIATTIGLDTATITSRLSAGESLGTIAGAKRQALIDALIAYHTKKIDQAVTDGKVTAAQATKLKAGLTAAVTSFVDRVPGKMKKGEGRGLGLEPRMGHEPGMDHEPGMGLGKKMGHGKGMKGPRGF